MKSVLQFHVVFLISCLPLCNFFILKYVSNVFTLKLLNSSLVFILLFDFWPIQIVNLNLVSKELIFWFHFRASLSSQTVLKWILELIWDALPLFTLCLRESPSAETLYFISVFIHRHFSSIFRKKIKKNKTEICSTEDTVRRREWIKEYAIPLLGRNQTHSSHKALL